MVLMGYSYMLLMNRVFWDEWPVCIIFVVQREHHSDCSESGVTLERMCGQDTALIGKALIKKESSVRYITCCSTWIHPKFKQLAAENPELSFAQVDIDQVPVSVHIICDDEEYILTAKCCRILLLNLVFMPCLLFSCTSMAKSSTNIWVPSLTSLPNVPKDWNDYSFFVSRSFFPMGTTWNK